MGSGVEALAMTTRPSMNNGLLAWPARGKQWSRRRDCWGVIGIDFRRISLSRVSRAGFSAARDASSHVSYTLRREINRHD